MGRGKERKRKAAANGNFVYWCSGGDLRSLRGRNNMQKENNKIFNLEKDTTTNIEQSKGSPVKCSSTKYTQHIS